MTTNDRVFIVACMTATVGAVVAVVAFLRPEPQVINVEAPLVNIDAVELAEAMSYERDPNTGQLAAWPDNTGVDEEQFLEDCRAVCSSPGIGSIRADGSLDPAPRMLYADFGHMVCACFDGDRVNRYVG